MKVLAIANISNTDDPMCDSGVIFQQILAKEFARMNIEYHIAIPNESSLRKLHFEQATIHSIPIGTTRYASRFQFDWDAYCTLFQHSFDIVFNNQIEITSALRAVLVHMGKAQTKIVSYCHYPALYRDKQNQTILDTSLNHDGLGLPIVFDILSAVHIADKVIIQSEFAKQLLQDAAASVALIDQRKANNNIEIIPPPAETIVTDHISIPSSRTIFYNHRLYESYGTNDLLHFIDEIQSLDFDFLVSDPMPSRSTTRSYLNHSPNHFRKRIANMPNTQLVDGNVNRSSYFNRIKSSRLALASWRSACVWSMAAVDCMGLGVPVVAPAWAAYPEFIPETLLFDSPKEARQCIQHLLHNDTFWQACSMQCLKKVESLQSTIIAKRFHTLFQTLLTNQQNSDQ